MDVFHKGLVVLQVFNQSDVKNWSFDIPLNEEGDSFKFVFQQKIRRTIKKLFKV